MVLLEAMLLATGLVDHAAEDKIFLVSEMSIDSRIWD